MSYPSSFRNCAIPSALGPLAKQRHDATPEQHAGERIQKLPVARLTHLGVEQELVREQLNEPSVDKNARAEGVEDTRDQSRACRAGIVCRAHAEAYPDAYRCRDSIEECTKRGHKAVFMRELEVREPGADTESFECLCISIDQPSSLCDRGI
jgi:hypothetical protein